MVSPNCFLTRSFLQAAGLHCLHCRSMSRLLDSEVSCTRLHQIRKPLGSLFTVTLLSLLLHWVNTSYGSGHVLCFISRKLDAKDSSPGAPALLLAFFSPEGEQAARDWAPGMIDAAELGLEPLKQQQCLDEAASFCLQ